MFNEILTFGIFLLIGLEIRAGLEKPKAALLPALSALGGMAFPALIFKLLQPESSAWATTMPTDVALAIGALSLLGNRVNPAVRLFLLTLAVSDDLLSLAAIGVFFRDDLHLASAIYTLGAALLGALLPWNQILTKILAPLVTFILIPLYIVLNLLLHLNFSEIVSTPSLSIAISRIVGKGLGITFFAYIGVRLLKLELPKNLDIKEIFGVGLLAGMGLTVSLVIADITLNSAVALDQVRMGLFLAALISGGLGLLWLKRFPASLSS